VFCCLLTHSSAADRSMSRRLASRP
jgi:hypothetical protein